MGSELEILPEFTGPESNKYNNNPDSIGLMEPAFRHRREDTDRHMTHRHRNTRQCKQTGNIHARQADRKIQNT